MPTNDPLSYFYPGIPTDRQRSPKRSFTNADVEPSREPFQDTIYGPWERTGAGPDIPDMDNYDDIMAGATEALRNTSDFGGYRDAQLASHAARQASEATPMPTGRQALVAASSPFLFAGGPLGMGAGAIMAGSSAMDFAEQPSMGSAITGLLGLAPLLGPVARGTAAAGRAAGSAASKYGQQAVTGLKQTVSRLDDSMNAISPHARAVATGQKRAIEAKKGEEILTQQRLGGRKPSPSYAQQIRQHAGEAEGIPSASMRGPRSQQIIRHLTQLPDEQELTAEQLWKHLRPEQVEDALMGPVRALLQGF